MPKLKYKKLRLYFLLCLIKNIRPTIPPKKKEKKIFLNISVSGIKKENANKTEPDNSDSIKNFLIKYLTII